MGWAWVARVDLDLALVVPAALAAISLAPADLVGPAVPVDRVAGVVAVGARVVLAAAVARQALLPVVLAVLAAVVAEAVAAEAVVVAVLVAAAVADPTELPLSATARAADVVRNGRPVSFITSRIRH